MNTLPSYAGNGSDCPDARTTLYGDYWMNPNQSLWFSGTLQSISDGFSCFWFSQDTLLIEVYVQFFGLGNCPGKLMYTGKATPNGTYELTSEYIRYRIDLALVEYGLGNASEYIYSSTAYLKIYAQNGNQGRLFINHIGVAPQSSAQGPFQAVEYSSYLINKQTNAYYQIAWHGDVKPDSIYVSWQPKDSADGFRADLLDKYPKVQFRQKNYAGESKGTAQRIEGTNRSRLRADAYNVAIAAGDSLFASFINVPDDGYFRFLALYNNYAKTAVVELCAGKSLQLTNGTYDKTGLYSDTLSSDAYIYSSGFWHRTIRTFDLHVAEPEVRETVELTVPELPTEYQGQILTTEGIHNLNLIDENGCNYIQPVRVTLETALNEAESFGLRVVPAKPKAGETMTVMTESGDHALYIYSVTGELVAQSRVGQPIIAPQKGIYLLRVNNNTVKVKIE